MFRRPVLGAAVVIGASRSAARHEVANQNERDLEAEQAMEMRAEQQQREDVERDRRTQLAVKEAIIEERLRSDQGHLQTVDSGGGGRLYCSACGSGLHDSDRFCPGCGRQRTHGNA
jgi:rubrerythrin